MKKSFILVLLAAVLCACTTPSGSYQPAVSLISFAEFADEITVEFERLEPVDATDAVLKTSLSDSP
jgi:hypothetical protein